MGLRKIGILVASVVGMLALSGAPAFAQDCFLLHAASTSHAGKSGQWVSMPLASILVAPAPDGFGMCQAEADRTVALVKAAGLPTVFFTRTTKVLPDAGGPGKGGIDHFDDSPVINQIMGIASGVYGTICTYGG